MATLYIGEFTGMTEGRDGSIVPVADHTTAPTPQVIGSLTTTPQSNSTAFNSRTRYLRLVSDVAIFYRVGTSPSAATTDHYLPAGVVEYIGINSGYQISARTVA